MNIAVLIKQVPRTDKIKIDKETGTLIRKGVESILNPYCEYALDMAVSIKKLIKNAKITVFTMGPASAKSVLQRAVALGADTGVLLNDKAFAGSDCWATAYTLSAGIKKILGVPDIIICGKQAIDGDTAQVPSEISEILGIPIIPYVVEIMELSDKIVVESELDDNLYVFSSKFPVLLTVGKGSNIKRMPSLNDAARAFGTQFICLSKDMIDCDKAQLGLNGSPTRVVKIEPSISQEECVFYDEENLDKGLIRMLDFMNLKKECK